MRERLTYSADCFLLYQKFEQTFCCLNFHTINSHSAIFTSLSFRFILSINCLAHLVQSNNQSFAFALQSSNRLEAYSSAQQQINEGARYLPGL
jgi:hypothetical protein